MDDTKALKCLRVKKKVRSGASPELSNALTAGKRNSFSEARIGLENSEFGVQALMARKA